MQKPILPKGTRDFNSEELYKSCLLYTSDAADE